MSCSNRKLVIMTRLVNVYKERMYTIMAAKPTKKK